VAAAALAAAASACGGADPTWPVTAAATSAPLSTLAPGPGGIVLTVMTGSKAVVRVREQLVTLVSPSDAVLTADSVSGRVAMRRDGTFVAGSRITVALDDLRSDSAQRDRYIKQQTLETRTYPLAEFTPSRATGLSLPLRADGEVAFKLTGSMAIHGVTRDVAFDVTAARVGREVVVTARNAAPWRFADFGLEIPRVLTVLSIVDEIRLEVQLVATDQQ
jgi:polyisoprenoid-binding protein YceI